MLKKGFIFSLDAVTAVYILLLSVGLVLSYIEVISQINYDDLYLSSYSNDFYNFDYYADILIYKLNLTDIYNLMASEECSNHRVYFGLNEFYYSSVKYSGYPNIWFQVGYKGNRLLRMAGDTFCFKNY
jgi:hypothetical protein